MAYSLAQHSAKATRSAGHRILLVLLFLFSCLQLLRAQTPPPPKIISTVAGGGPSVMPKLNGAVSNVASTGEVGQIAWDPTRNVFYFTASTFHRVYKYDPVAGQATVLAGNGLSGFQGDGGNSASASLAGPLGLVLDPTNPNLLYVADSGNNRIRRINLATGTIDTIFGNGLCTVGLLPYGDVAASSADVCTPAQMAIDSNGVLYIYDIGRTAIWRLAGGQARLIAGSGMQSNAIPTDPVIAINARLGPFGYLAVDAAGQFLYLNDAVGLRRLDLTTGVLYPPIDTPPTTPLLDQFGAPTGVQLSILHAGSPVAIDPATGNVIYGMFTAAAPTTESIVIFDPVADLKTSIAGAGTNAPPFLTPTNNVNLGGITNAVGELVAIAPTGSSAGTFVASRSGWIHAMDSLSSGANFTTLLGNGFRSWCGDGGPATNACLDDPTSIVGMPDGSFFIADHGNNVVRFVDSGGIIHSLLSPRAISAAPLSIARIPPGTTMLNPFLVDPITLLPQPFPSETLFFTSDNKHQIFTLDPTTDTTSLYSGHGNAACTDQNGLLNCFIEGDAGLTKPNYDQPRGLVIDPLGNPFLVEPRADMLLCLDCTDPIVPIEGWDPLTFRPITEFNNPYVLSLDFDNGLLVGESGTNIIQRIAPDPSHGGVTAFFPRQQFVTEVLNPSQLPLPNVTPMLPVGITRIPGMIIAADNYNRIVWSTTRSPLYQCPTFPVAVICDIPPTPPQIVSAFAGGGTDALDNIPAIQTKFGFRMVEAGVFDPQQSLGELNAVEVAANHLVFITDRADNRIRLVTTGANHAPTAHAGGDKKAAKDPLDLFYTALLDGTGSTDPDGDLLTYTWTENGNVAGTGPLVEVNLSLGTHVFTLTVSDGYGGTSSDTTTVTVTPPVDLSIAATASPTTVNTGDAVTYTATVTNLGPNDGTGVVVTLPILSSTDFVSGTAPGGACAGPAAGSAGTITCLVGNLANGANANLSITVKPHASGTLTSVLTAASDFGDPDTSNNSATISVTVNQPTTAQVTVNEVIHVTDSVALLPSAMVTVAEHINVTDSMDVLPSVLLVDVEAISVSDQVNVLPSVMLNDAEAIQVADTVAVLPSVLLNDVESVQVVDSPAVNPAVNTPIGSATLILPDQNGNPSAVSLTFTGGVMTAGYTSVTIGTTAPPLPSGFELIGSPAVYYDVTTTAQYSPPITVCIAAGSMPFNGALLHFDSALQVWQDITIRPVPSKGPICGQVNSLSPFAIVAPSNHPPTANAGSDQTVEATSAAGAAVNLSGSGSDPDNDPLTFTWTENGSTLGTGAQITVTLPMGAHTITLTADDGRGGTGTSSVTVTVQDTTPPSITITTPAPANLLVNQSVAASYSCTDAASGVATCVGTIPSGKNLDTGSPGSFSFTVNASDKAGNTSSRTVKYSVGYNICLLYDPSKAKKSGSTYPIQIRLCDAGGNNLSSSAIAVHAISVTVASTNAPGVLQDAGNSNPDLDFRYDASLGGYIFNLQTTGYATGTYNLNFTAGSDPGVHSVSFQIR